MSRKKDTLITAGNIYLDYNIFGVNNDGKNILEVGKDYFAEKTEIVVGGSAVNFAIQAVNLGIPTAVIGKVGKDENGLEAKRLLCKMGIESDLVLEAPDVTTSVAYNMVFARTGEFIGVHDGNAAADVSPEQIDLQHPIFQRACAIYFGGTVKQKKLIKHFPRLLQSIRKAGIKVVLDPNRFSPGSPENLTELIRDSLKYVDCYLPNEEEVKQVAGKDTVSEAIETIMSYGVTVLAVKQGARGCHIITSDQDIHIDGFSVRPITTVGAGDVFNASFVCKWLNGESLSECARFANAAAAIKVSKNVYLTRKDVESFLQAN